MTFIKPGVMQGQAVSDQDSHIWRVDVSHSAPDRSDQDSHIWRVDVSVAPQTDSLCCSSVFFRQQEPKKDSVGDKLNSSTFN